ncbi:hypothetical protein KUH03_24520 [Sphingobacterium sp. E70]|uniref:hypothetical protein n=1 Tax=Sphingobacterium sp. E70 TaxID=2853439 RepID=UPI00211B88D2|nr:hypothetical protein [Sphingobacterium sp. E70]ULT22538.1 hypothetical protein KUH03_24520 [Sphingobacterium sp. E70]
MLCGVEYNFESNKANKIKLLHNTFFLIIHSLNAILSTSQIDQKIAWFKFEGTKINSIYLKTNSYVTAVLKGIFNVQIVQIQEKTKDKDFFAKPKIMPNFAVHILAKHNAIQQ